MKFEKYSRTFLHFHRKEVPELLLKYLPERPFSLVDLGAGDGALLVALQHSGYITEAHKVSAVDLSPERCERLRRSTNFEVFCSDVTNIPSLGSGSFEYAICTQVIEHVDQGRLLAEISRILQPNGILYIASLVKKGYGWWYYRTAEGKWGIDPTHLREYASKEMFEGVLGSAGLKVLETRLTPLRLSVLEFLVRRVAVPLFRLTEVNAFFLQHGFIDFLRRNINIRPPGYSIIETVAMK